MDGRRGLVPSNYITKLVGEDLMEFHQSMVVGTSGAGVGEVADDGWSTSIPQVSTNTGIHHSISQSFWSRNENHFIPYSFYNVNSILREYCSVSHSFWRSQALAVVTLFPSFILNILMTDYLIAQDLPMPHVMRDLPSSAALTPEPHFDPWEEHEHLMNPMFLQSPDEIDLPPLDPELLDHQRRRQVKYL